MARTDGRLRADRGPTALATGKVCGGHTLNLHKFARDGVTLLGRIQGVRDHSILLAQDLKANLASADQFEADLNKKIDEFIARIQIDAPKETPAVLTDGYGVQEIAELNLVDANTTTLIWATGYTFDFSLVQLPVFDSDGYPLQKRGVTDHPGLYLVGLPWLYNARSGLLFALPQDAGHIAATIDKDALVRESARRRFCRFSGRVDCVATSLLDWS